MTLDFEHWETVFSAHVVGIEAVDAGHDINHIKRVVKAAKQFAAEEQAEMAVVLPAAWLHDCVQVAKDSPLRKEASRLAAEEAKKLLATWGYPEQYHEAVAHAVAAHSFSANIPCESLEAKVVQDADRIDALGAIGIARTMLVGQSFGNPLLASEDPFCENRTANDQSSIIDHFYTKLLGLKDTFQTDAARAEANKRHEFMVTFLKQLADEV